jgi:hypothetical protein
MRYIFPLAGVLLLCAMPALRAQGPTQSARELVKDVVYNELQERRSVSLWQYRVDKRVGAQTTVQQEIETTSGPVFKVLERQGRPLDPAAQKKESERLQNLVRNHADQARMKQDWQADERRVQRLIAAMPDAFLCTYDGMDDGNVRLSFQPNPAYSPPTYEARVFHALAGKLWIEPEQKRLVKVDAHIINDIDFGYGLLGRIEKGGNFQIKRQRVAGNRWKTSMLNVHVSGRIVFFKAISKDQDEVRSNFQTVPDDLDVAGAIALLNR